jgi:hypothetical protein
MTRRLTFEAPKRPEIARKFSTRIFCKKRDKIIEAETIASESEAASAGDTPALRKTEFQVELRHRLRADPSNEVRREALALLTNAQLRETVQQQLDQVLAKRRL